ncbi:MAG: hypothetical protein ACRDBG_19925 [Waterburya sp.]
MSILKIYELALKLVAKDFSDGHASNANNAGPTKTSRALAIIHLAAHDAYAKVTGQLTPRLTTLPNPPQGIGNDEVTGIAALISAGIFAAEQLYPDFVQFIEVAAKLLNKTPEAITLRFVSDEFNGKTTDNLGTVRPRYSAKFTLREAIEENKISRIYLGVHWDFDATGGETVGKAIAEKVFAAFR